MIVFKHWMTLVGKVVHPVTPNGGIFNLLTAYNEENAEAPIDLQLGESGNFAQRFQALNDECRMQLLCRLT